MRSSIVLRSLSAGPLEKLSAVSKAGFNGVELSEEDYITFAGAPVDMGRALADHGLRGDLFRHPFALTDDDDARWADRAERSFDLMEDLGTDLLLVTLDEAVSGSDRLGSASEELLKLAERAAARGFRIGLETEGLGLQDYGDFIAASGADNLGLVLDSLLCLTGAASPDLAKDLDGTRIFHVRFSDAPDIGVATPILSKIFRTMPGEGDLPLAAFASSVASTGYTGAYGVDVPPQAFWEGHPRVAAIDAHRTLVALLDKVRHVNPDAEVDLPAFPPPGPVERVEFVEFTADAKEARVLGDLLQNLGFAPVGRHVSKDVTLWQQGDIRLMVNSERSGFAHSAYVMHGTCVCDIGLLVGDAKQAIRRAKALGAHPFLQRHNEGELDIPAIRGVGGTIVHFLDSHSDLARVWDTEFRSLPDEDSAPLGQELTRIDHLAQTMSHDELTVWSQFYTTIFDLHRTSLVEITDPGGPVRSRAIESRDGNLRLTLNAADTHRTFAGRFMDEGAGPAVQHIAFETANLIETADVLAKRCFKALPIPEVYYKNLAVWFDLSPEFVDDLKSRNLLYDEDTDGHYLQLYSLPYGDGFFFELVQRSGGYSGYGARNAPYRTAALKRANT